MPKKKKEKPYSPQAGLEPQPLSQKAHDPQLGRYQNPSWDTKSPIFFEGGEVAEARVQASLGVFGWWWIWGLFEIYRCVCPHTRLCGLVVMYTMN